MFERHFGGAGTWDYPWPDEEQSKLREIDEAWIPVITPDGPGVLVWFNSD